MSVRLLLLVASFLLASILPANAEKRLALVIGNDDYSELQRLNNAVNDAKAVSEAVEGLGFTVIRRENQTLREMRNSLFDLTDAVRPGDTVFVFYAGHGTIIGGANYLLPIDTPDVQGTNGENDVPRAALREAYVVQQIKAAGAKLTIMILDSCRNNPFTKLDRSLPASRGLARAPEERGVFTIYSAGFDQTALDRLNTADTNQNSVFTRELVPALKEPGLNLVDIAYRVSERVEELALQVNHEQTPAYYDQARGQRVYLAGASKVQQSEEAETTTAFSRIDQDKPAFEQEPTIMPSPSGDISVEKISKFTQRLRVDGTEIDVGLEAPAPEGLASTEGTSVAAVDVETARNPPVNDNLANSGDAEIEYKEPVAMFLYEERLGQSAPTAIKGNVAWSIKEESPGGDAKPEPVIKAQINVPERGLTALVTIKRNADVSLPASHVIEFVFSLPNTFEGGGIDSVQRVAMKRNEQDRGDALIAVPAKITEDFHMIALNDFPEAVTTNTELLRRRSWIDIPLTYRNGTRALLTLPKGPVGEAAFDDAIKAWNAGPKVVSR